MKNATLEIDPTRPIHYEGDYSLKISDFFSTMYGSPKYVEKSGQYKKTSTFTIHSIKPEQYRGKPRVQYRAKLYSVLRVDQSAGDSGL